MKTFYHFAENAHAVRKEVINNEFMIHKGPDGGEYPGISVVPTPATWPRRLAELLKKEIHIHLSGFRLNHSGELPQSYVHSDLLCGRYATVLYLNLPEQCAGGTAFWQHQCGLWFMPNDQQVIELDWGPLDKFHACMTNDWKREALWRRIGFSAMQWNKLITYPTCLFHSRWPHAAFGSGPSDGRLVWVCFYDVKE